MSSLPLESVQEWMWFLDRETVDSCFVLSRKLCAAASSMTALRFVDTAHLREYETMRNYNVTIAWTTVARSRRGKPKTEKKALRINRENCCEALTFFASALRFCVVKEQIEVNLRSLLLHGPDVTRFGENVRELRLKDARVSVGTVQFDHLDDFHAASAILSTVSARYYFTTFALSMDLLEWADANDAYHKLPSLYFGAHAFSEEMILYRCFGGRSTERVDECLYNPPVSPQFLQKLVKARRDAATRRRVRLTIRLPAGRLEVEQLKDPEMSVVTRGNKHCTFKFADIEDFELEYSIPYGVQATLTVTAN